MSLTERSFSVRNGWKCLTCLLSLFPPLAHSGDHPGCRTACYGHGWHIWPIRKGLPAAWQEEEVWDQGPQEDPQPCLQWTVHLQGTPHTECSKTFAHLKHFLVHLLVPLTIWFACSCECWEGVETATSWHINKLLTECLSHTKLQSHTRTHTHTEAHRDWD